MLWLQRRRRTTLLQLVMLNKRDTSMVEKKIEVSRSPATIDTIDITIDVFTALVNIFVV